MNKAIKFLKAVFLHKRMKAFYWHAGTMGISELAFVLPAILTDFQAPQWLIVGVGLIFAQITKHLNKKR